MKRNLISIVLTALIILTACSSPANDSFIGTAFYNSAVYDNYVISINSDRILTYYDLSEGTSSAACTTAGCDHSDPESCTANLSGTVARFPFRYGESIYFTDYSLDGENVSTLYKCNLNGGNRESIYTIRSEKIDEKSFSAPMVLNTFLGDERLYMLIGEDIYTIDDDPFGKDTSIESKSTNYRIVSCELSSGSCEEIYSTSYCYDSDFTMFGVSDGVIYCSHKYNRSKYVFETQENFLASANDPNSDYNSSKAECYLYIDSSTGTSEERKYDGGYYSVGKSGAYKFLDGQLLNAENELIAENVQAASAVSEGVVFSDGSKNFLYDGKKTAELSSADGYNICGESKDYLLFYKPDNSGYVYCKKTDYYNGRAEYLTLE
ncbi:MAG: hypothetical protein ACI4SF_13080 [Oscillospiraceae bacterium]